MNNLLFDFLLVFRKKFKADLVLPFDDIADFKVDHFASSLRIWLLEAIFCCIVNRAKRGYHAVVADDSLSDLGALLDIVRSTRRYFIKEYLFGNAASECDSDHVTELLLRI